MTPDRTLDVLTAIAAIALVMALAVAWCVVILERVDPRVDTRTIDWRNMARHRARFEESERARRALREAYFEDFAERAASDRL